MTTLPDGTVEVITDNPSMNTHRTTIVLRKGGSRDVTKTGEADTANGATARAVKEILKDPYTLEHIERRS